MANNSILEGYSDPEYRILKEARMTMLQGPASATDFAHFRSRNKVILRAVHVNLRSAASGTAGSLHVCISQVTVASKTVSSCSVGYSACITLTSSNTLSSMGEYASLRVTGAADKGKWDVLWEYDVCYPATKIGS